MDLIDLVTKTRMPDGMYLWDGDYATIHTPPFTPSQGNLWSAPGVSGKTI